jgi:transposase InsO family protein
MVRRRNGRTTIRVPGVASVPIRCPATSRPMRRIASWVADRTDVAAWEGKLYLAVVIDCFSRR